MKAVRPLLVAVILLNLALLAVCPSLRATVRRYDMARARQELRVLALENQTLLHHVAVARRPDQVAARAATFGIDLRNVEYSGIIRPGEASSAGPKPMAKAKR